jgi:hypothetical protein
MLFGLLDSSVIRVPGSRDALTVLLCADQRMWSYYAFMVITGRSSEETSHTGWYAAKARNTEGVDAFADAESGHDFRQIGLWRNCGTGLAAASIANGSILDSRGCHAVLPKKFPSGAL